MSYRGQGLHPRLAGVVRLVPGAVVVAVPLASHGPDRVEDDEELRRRVLEAYAPGEVVEVTGLGGLPDTVATVIAFEQPSTTRAGLVLFFTGLSGSGKSTLARALHDLIVERGGIFKRADKFLPLLDLRAPVVPAQLRNEAGVVGAAVLAAELG